MSPHQNTSSVESSTESNIESSGMNIGADNRSEISGRPETMNYREVSQNRQMESQFTEKVASYNTEKQSTRENKSEIIEKQVNDSFPVSDDKSIDNSKDFHFMDKNEFSAELKNRDSSYSESDINRTNGFHDPKDNQAFVLDGENTYKTAIHEKLHQKSKSDMPTRLNEGITENYAREKAGAIGDLKKIDDRGKEINLPKSDYEKDVQMAQKLEAIVGRDSVNKAYFDGKTNELRADVDEALGKGSFDKITNTMENQDYNKTSEIIKNKK